jgi:hypothetical protein
MKTSFALAASLAVAVSLPGCYIDGYYDGPLAPPIPTDPTAEVTVAEFYEPLSAHGAWVDMAPYGRVWVPSEEVVGTDYVPYTSGGQWVSTDVGYVFQSQWDNEWGWATYHYGRWLYTEEYGWAWVPDTEWGPAWVDWRYGGAYVGWAPMAPVGVVLVPGAYAFVETRYLGEAGIYRYRVPAQHVAVVYGATVPSPEVRMNGAARWSMGPPAAHVAASGARVTNTHYNVPARGEIRSRAAAARTRGGSRRSAPRVRGGGRRR